MRTVTQPQTRAPVALHKLVKTITVDVPAQRRRAQDARLRMLRVRR